ncbi:MAG: LysM peptidoglycan-binding domain-containing protein [Candidatus Limnocylindrales bacterium]
MVNRDDDNLTRKKRPAAHPRPGAKPVGSTDSGEGERHERAGFRPVTQANAAPVQPAPLPFYKVPSGSETRRGPSYPAWEKPPTPYNYPRLRGREVRKPMWAIWPPILAAIGVVLVVFVMVVLPALLGRGGNAAVASPSASATATASPRPSSTPGPSPSSVGSAVAGSPVPNASFEQYKVQAGDTITRIANKKGLKSWELLLANPGLAANPNSLKIGLTINIPLPGQLTPPPG